MTATRTTKNSTKIETTKLASTPAQPKISRINQATKSGIYGIDPDLATGPYVAYNIPQTDSYGVANSWQANCLVSHNAAGMHATFASKDVATRVAANANFSYQASLPTPTPQVTSVTATQTGGVTIDQLNDLIRRVYDLANQLIELRKSCS